MAIFILLVSFILVSNVNTFYILQPIENSTDFPIPYTPKAGTVNDTQLGNTHNKSSAVDLLKVVKDGSKKEEVSFLVLLGALAKEVLFEEKVKTKQPSQEPKNMTSNSGGKVSSENRTVASQGETSKTVQDVETKNPDSPSIHKSPSKENSTKFEKVVGKVDVVETAELTVGSLFTSESRSKESPKKDDVVNSDDIIEFSFPSSRPVKDRSTKDNDLTNVMGTVLDTELSHNISTKISKKYNKLTDTSIDNTCDSSHSLCKSSQECRHGNVCTYVLILSSSLYFYLTVGAFD